MVIKDIQKGVPRGSYKASLIDDGMSMTILLNREMSSDQVGEIITKALMFKNIPYYTVLECNGVKLSPSVEHGSTLIKLAQKQRKFYLCLPLQVGCQGIGGYSLSYGLHYCMD